MGQQPLSTSPKGEQEAREAEQKKWLVAGKTHLAAAVLIRK